MVANLGMLRAAAGCRRLWHIFEGSTGIKRLIGHCTHNREGVQEIQYEARESLQALLSPACEAPGLESELPKLSNALPCIINGAMTDANGWEAVSWSKHDLLAACNGDTLVPVEVSIDSGDYRDLYRPAQSSSRRQFEAGVPVPLSFLLEHIQQLSGESEQVCLIILVAASLALLPTKVCHSQCEGGVVRSCVDAIGIHLTVPRLGSRSMLSHEGSV